MSYVEKFPWIIHFDGSGCSGCGMEAQACFSPKFDLEQYGVRKTDNPRHADVLLITGIVQEENREQIQELYDRMAEPKAVVAAVLVPVPAVFSRAAVMCSAVQIRFFR